MPDLTHALIFYSLALMQILWFAAFFCQFAPEFSSVKPISMLGLGPVCPGAPLNPVEMLGTST